VCWPFAAHEVDLDNKVDYADYDTDHDGAVRQADVRRRQRRLAGPDCAAAAPVTVGVTR
jgi:hypothetical protein